MLKPNHLTITSLLLALVAMQAEPWIALPLFTASFMLDVLDGWLARKKKLVTRFGGVLDSVIDKLVEIIFITYLGNKYNALHEAVPAAGLSIMVSYAKHRSGLKIKSFFDRPQRLIYLLLTALLPNFNFSLMVYNVLCVTALVQIMRKIYKRHKSK